ncbi:unnamed protein product, partial [Symbiodinium sp. KB8]
MHKVRCPEAATGYTDQLISHMPESFRFQREVLDGRNIALGAKLLLALNAASILLAYVLIWLLLLMFRNPADCDTDCQVNLHNCAVGDLLIEVNGGFGRVVADIVYLVIVIPTVIYCFMWEVSEQDRHMRRRIYLVMLIIVYVRLWLMCRNFGFFLLNKDMGSLGGIAPFCVTVEDWKKSVSATVEGQVIGNGSRQGVFYLAPWLQQFPTDGLAVAFVHCLELQGTRFERADVWLGEFSANISRPLSAAAHNKPNHGVTLAFQVAMLAVHALVKTPEQRYHAYFDTLIGSDPSDGRKLH